MDDDDIDQNADARRRKLRVRLYRHLIVATDCLSRMNDMLSEPAELIEHGMDYADRQAAIAAEALVMLRARIADYKRSYLFQGGEERGREQ